MLSHRVGDADAPAAEASLLSRAFSLLSEDRASEAAGWALVEWMAKVTNFAFGLFHPLLISRLGDRLLGGGQGKSLFAFLQAANSAATVASYLTFASLLRFSTMKTRCLYFFGSLVALSLLLLLLCFSPGAVYLACVLAVVGKVSQRLVDVAHESLLDAVCQTRVPPRDPHQLSARAAVTGYAGMLAFVLAVAPLLALLHFLAGAPALWVELLVPTACAGLWYATWLAAVSTLLPWELGAGPPLPRPEGWVEGRGNGALLLLRMCWLGLRVGVAQQLDALRLVAGMRDLSLFVAAFIFISGAASTAVSVAAIVASEVLRASLVYIVASALVGLLAATAGLAAYKQLLARTSLSAKHAIVLCILVLAGMLLYVPSADSLTGLFAIAAVGGSQIGAVGSFARSMVSALAPETQQAQLFAFYELTQDGTAWVGPLVVGALTASLGAQTYVRVVVYVCLVELGIGLPLLLLVDMRRGEELRSRIDGDCKARATEEDPPLAHVTPA